MKLKKLLPYFVVFLVAFLATPLAGNWIIREASEQAKALTQDFHPDPSRLPDGFYEGRFKAFNLITFSRVTFHLKGGKIRSLEFKKMYHTPGYLSKKEIEATLKERQNLDLDALTGATRTSSFAKAAIKNAITKQHIK
ncbi:MAG: FMN-binding protein [Bacteroidales bacterium]|jgi:uncharacterized protein with FMN-binding domain|nr:FMN-binding protein [Bacteroidales bacterium]